MCINVRVVLCDNSGQQCRGRGFTGHPALPAVSRTNAVFEEESAGSFALH